MCARLPSIRQLRRWVSTCELEEMSGRKLRNRTDSYTTVKKFAGVHDINNE